MAGGIIVGKVSDTKGLPIEAVGPDVADSGLGRAGVRDRGVTDVLQEMLLEFREVKEQLLILNARFS